MAHVPGGSCQSAVSAQVLCVLHAVAASLDWQRVQRHRFMTMPTPVRQLGCCRPFWLDQAVRPAMARTTDSARARTDSGAQPSAWLLMAT